MKTALFPVYSKIKEEPSNLGSSAFLLLIFSWFLAGMAGGAHGTTGATVTTAALVVPFFLFENHFDDNQRNGHYQYAQHSNGSKGDI